MNVAPERDTFTDQILIQLPPQVQARAAFLRHVGLEENDPVAAVQQAHREGASVPDLARAMSVDVRTIYRYLNTSTPCPGPRCLTMVRGGGLCRFCRRSV